MSDAAFCLIGLIMPQVWQVVPSNSRATADHDCGCCDRDPGELIPRFPVVRVLVDSVKQLFTTRLVVLGQWGFFLLSIGLGSLRS
jgi:hypothetical protein